jgi:ribose 5-phosphate isomerase B
MKLVIGSDKSGFLLKESIKKYLDEAGISYDEVGTTDIEKPAPFWDTALRAVELIQKGDVETGILICGTGMGMSQVANSYKGIRAACVESVYAAKMCRAINDSNILCMGGWIIAPELGIEMTKLFLATGFTEGLEPWRREFLGKAKAEFKAIEDAIYK